MASISPGENTSDLHLEIANHPEDLAEALGQFEAFLELRQAAPRFAHAVRLAIEEVVTNTIKYSYDDTAEHRISIAFSLGPPATLRIQDDGQFFDPLAHPPVPDTDAQIEERQIGGLGLHIVRSQALSMDYSRVDGINQLDLVFPQ